MLQKFLRIYSIVIAVLLVIVIIGAIYFYMQDTPLKACYCGFVAIVIALMWWVTKSFVKRINDQQKRLNRR